MLDEGWLKLAQENWNQFIVDYKSIYQSELLKRLEKQGFLLEPSISIGSKILSEGDSFNQLTSVTSCQAGICKRVYKEAKGADTTKYGGIPANDVLLNENIKNKVIIKPQALPPIGL